VTVMDEFSDVFSDTPDFCDAVMHSIPVLSEFKPKRLEPEVDKQIDDLFTCGFVKPSKSPMASPLVCVLEGRDGEGGVPLASTSQCFSAHSIVDAFHMSDMADAMQRIVETRYRRTFDACGRYWQTATKAFDQCLFDSCITLTQLVN
jgi:hypothetical protein